MQEMTMVERVSRELSNEFFGVGWYDRQDDEFKKRWTFMARAAIEAMREPTERMILARYKILKMGSWPEYEAMIDAALSE